MSSVEPPSRIRYVETQDGEIRRQAHLLSLQGASNRLSDREFGIDAYMYINVAVFLAWKHVQQRRGAVVPSLPRMLEGCDLDWSMESRDTQFSPSRGVRALINATTDPTITNNTNTTSGSPNAITANSTDTASNSKEWQFPFAVVGAVYSSVSLPITMLGQGHGLPQISASATSTLLEYAPYFARTIPRNDADALALLLHYQSIGVTHMACVYIKDPWGTYYVIDIQNTAKQFGIEVVAFAYDHGNRASIRSALKQLKQSGMRHVFAIMFSWVPVIEEAIALEVVGRPDYSWIGAEMIEWTAGNLEFNRSNPEDLKMAHALRGVGSLLLDGGSTNINNKNFVDVMKDFANSPSLQQEYVQTYAPEDRHIFNNYTFEYLVDYFFQKGAYDATYGLAIAACQTPGLFTGPELYKTLIELEYEGVTGTVRFDKVTGTRQKDSVMVRVDNVFWSEELSDEEFIRLGSHLAKTISQSEAVQISPWMYYDNTTNAPPSLPPLDFNYNLIPLAAQIVGWILGGLVVCLSLALIAWTWHNRERFVVKAGQPLFLTQLCIGTLVMALAVIPMGMQGTEPSARLDAACMAVPWLLLLGFVIAFSALFSKTWRLNQLLNSGMSMKRIQVQAKDVIWPFVVLMTLNVACLLGWTLLSPLEYVHIQSNSVDSWGRRVEGHGQCQSPDNNYLYFMMPIVLFDFVGMATATYQSYVARNLPTILSESFYLALAMASLLETFLLGGPMLFMSMDNPTAFFLVGTCLVCITSMTILLPIFVPKYQNRGITEGARAGSLVSSNNFRAGGGSSSRLGTGSSRRLAGDSKRGFMYITSRRLDASGLDASGLDGNSAHSVNSERRGESFTMGNIGNTVTRRSSSCLDKRTSGLEPVQEHSHSASQ